MNKKFSVLVKKKIDKFNKTIKIPADKGLSIRSLLLASQCIGKSKIKNLLKMAGLKDAWTTAKGPTPTMNSTSKAVLECLRQTFSQG